MVYKHVNFNSHKIQKKGWTWYHSFFSMMGKFFICRLIIAVVRKINRGKVSVT